MWNQGGLTSPFTTIPKWYINGVSLDIEDKLTYLGTILGENGGKEHGIPRTRVRVPVEIHVFHISSTVKTIVEQHIFTFWAPGAGIKSPGVNSQTALHLFNVGVSSTLTYGCASIYINKSQLVNLTYKTVSWLEMSNTYYSSHESLRN